jgi:hypothetical protein
MYDDRIWHLLCAFIVLALAAQGARRTLRLMTEFSRAPTDRCCVTVAQLSSRNFATRPLRVLECFLRGPLPGWIGDSLSPRKLTGRFDS